MLVTGNTRRRRHRRGILSAFCRVWAILALVLMPLSMTGLPASAADAGPASVSLPCEGHQQPAQAPLRHAHCTSCAAIRAPDVAPPAMTIVRAPILDDRNERVLLGRTLDVATPPPKDA